MRLMVTLAQSDADRREAYELVRQVYAREFNVDLDQLREKATISFRSDVLLIRDERQELVGTASILYPADSYLFPSEYMFGADIQQSGQELPLGNTVEVGRLAKANVEDRGLVIQATMLAVNAYLRRENLSGWIATVKLRMKRMLQMTKLEMQDFAQSPHKTSFNDVPNLLDGYKGKDVSFFWASAESTYQAFEKLYGLLDQGIIQIDLDSALEKKAHVFPILGVAYRPMLPQFSPTIA